MKKFRVATVDGRSFILRADDIVQCGNLIKFYKNCKVHDKQLVMAFSAYTLIAIEVENEKK